MRPDPASVALGLAVGLLLAALYVLWWKLRYTRALRRDAVLRSEAVTTGKISEQLVPIFTSSASTAGTPGSWEHP